MVCRGHVCALCMFECRTPATVGDATVYGWCYLA
eukprot:COSAG01_NODE_71628_length_255_cov_0.666667_1_plen_33_part_01